MRNIGKNRYFATLIVFYQNLLSTTNMTKKSVLANEIYKTES